jgi:uncharacterized protein (TIGR02996 family)
VSHLFDMIVASPGDDAPRQIYAGMLLETGDPRGEFIAIHFKLVRGEASAFDRVHLRELTRAYEPEWLGDLVGVLAMRVYRAGFLERATLATKADAEVWDRASRDERLGTIRALDPGSAREPLYKPFVFSPAMKNLTEAWALSPSMLQEMCSRTTPWAITSLVLRMPVAKDVLAMLASASRVFPRLSEIAFEQVAGSVDGMIEALAAWSERRHFHTLSFAPLTDVRRPQLQELSAWVGASNRLAPVERLGIWLPLCRAYVTRHDGTRQAEVEVRDDLFLSALLESVAGAEIAEVTVRPPPREACCKLDNPRHFVAALRALKAKRVVLPPSWDATIQRGY